MNMIVKIKYLFSHHDCFPENLGDIRDEQDKQFYQDLNIIEIIYQGHRDTDDGILMLVFKMRYSSGSTFMVHKEE